MLIHSSRTHTVSYRFLAYLALCLAVLIMSWESQLTHAAIVTPGQQSIPQESIRLRILANSDSPADQLLKRTVRDEIVKQMGLWVSGPKTLEEARQIVNDHLPEINDLVGRTLTNKGASYPYTVELGMVPFPTKMYGGEVYPAGEYEALLVTIGTGEGQNWWCVLFPPLCFIDIATGEAKPLDTDSDNVKNKPQYAARTTGYEQPQEGQKTEQSKAVVKTTGTVKKAESATSGKKKPVSLAASRTAKDSESFSRPNVVKLEQKASRNYTESAFVQEGQTETALPETAASVESAQQKPEVRLFVVDLANKVGGIIRGWF